MDEVEDQGRPPSPVDSLAKKAAAFFKGYPETAHPVVCVARIALHGDATD
jgi:hypothetical protein